MRRRSAASADGEPLPFADPAEAHVPGRWAGGAGGGGAARRTPRWADRQDGIGGLVGAAVTPKEARA